MLTLKFQLIEGAHKAGLATTFEAYRCVVVPLFEALDRVERMLKDKTYLIGDRLTAADISLYTTLVCFSCMSVPSLSTASSDTV